MINGYKSTPKIKKFTAVLFAALLLAPIEGAWAADNENAASIENLSLDDLMQTEVSSVSRKSQTLSNTAAAVFVVNQEDIRRSGATSIPEALRYVPGLEVSQGSSHTWDISARGFNGQYANKLLVLIDGRAVYSPLYGGVIWELQDTMMEDIERIEVIRGPGAAMWGSNAVNGVINVITKKSKDTKSDLLVAGSGNQEHVFAGFRHGGSFADNDGSYRVYGKGFTREASVNTIGQQQDDAWRSRQIGFRMDHLVTSGNVLTLQGDAYKINMGEPLTDNAGVIATLPTNNIANYIPNDASVYGGNLMARWNSTLSNGSEIILQGYYDRAQIDSLFLGEDTETVDIDFQHRLHPNTMNDLMWGINYRHIHFAAKNTPNTSFASPNLGYQNVSAFVQDDISLAERLRLTLGTKAEDSYFGGMQLQPNARLLWTPDNKNSLWLSASKASRTPSLVETEASAIVTPLIKNTKLGQTNLAYPVIQGNPNLKTETVTSLEAGYRTQWNSRLSTDIAIYSNEYRNIINSSVDGTVTPMKVIGGVSSPMTAPGIPTYVYLPMTFRNGSGSTQAHGLEISTDWRALDWMRLEGAFSYAKMNSILADQTNVDSAGVLPRTQESLRSLMDLNEKTKLNIALRHVGALDASSVPAYNAADANIAYTPYKGLNITLAAQNMLGQHVEFNSNGFSNRQPSVIQHSIYAKVTWNH